MKLGEAIRSRRVAAKLRLVDLAAKVEVSASYLSQVERDRVVPSVTALTRIAKALGTSAGVLLDGTEGRAAPASPVVRKNQRKVMLFPGSEARNELLTPDLHGALEVMWTKIPPGTRSPLFQHEGEECGVVLRGQLVYWLDEERYLLRAGDSISYRSHIPHRYENQSGKVVETIWVITPPSF